jgi:hypothetical protein
MHPQGPLFVACDLFPTVPRLAALQIPNSPMGLEQWNLRPFRLAGNGARENLEWRLTGPPAAVAIRRGLVQLDTGLKSAGASPFPP